MKFVIVFVALFALAVAGPVSQEVETLRSDIEVNPESHGFNVETSDGSKFESHGELRNGAYIHKGTYTHVGDDGVTYTVQYVADEHGFRPVGEHLPVAPAV